MIACQEHRTDAQILKFPDHSGALRPKGVRQGEKARRHAVQRQIDHGTALFEADVRFSHERSLHRHAVFLKKLSVPRKDLPSLCLCLHSPARNHGKLLRLSGRLPSLFLITAHYGLSQRVLRPLLGSGRKGKQLFSAQAFLNALRFHHAGRSACQRTRLVKGDASHRSEPFQSVALADQEPVLCRIADRRHDRSGGGKHQRTGAEYHQDGDCTDDLSGEKPGQRRRTEGDHHDPGGPPVGDSNDLRISGVRGLHQPDHALDGTVLSNPFGLHVKGAELVDRAALHLISRFLIHWQGFSCHNSLIDGGLSGKDDAVHGHRLSGQHAEHISHLYLARRNQCFRLSRYHSGRLRGQMHQAFNAGPRLCNGHILQQRAQLHDERHLSRRKILSDNNRSDQRNGHQHIRLDVKFRDETDKRLQQDGNAAQQNGCPGRVKGERQQIKNTDDEGGSGNHQTDDLPAHASPFQKGFQCTDQFCILHTLPHFHV